MSLFKKKDENRKEAYKPSDDNVSAKEGSSGGKGGGEPAAPSVDPTTKSGKAAIKKSMDDGRFGYGYIDRNTGVEVPWYIDMINGGGANAAGDTFVSPFAELPFGGGLASMPTNLANAAGIAPYGYNQPRRYAQAGMQGYPTAASPAPIGGGVSGGSSAMTPAVDNSQYGDAGFYDGMEVNRPAPMSVANTAASEDAYTTPRMYRSMDRQVGLFNQGQNSAAPVLPVGADNGGAELARLNLLRQQAVGNKPVPQDDMPAILSFGGGDRSTLPAMTPPSSLGVGSSPSDPVMAAPPAAMTMFTARMNTVPEMLRGTRIEEMYRKYLLGGNTGTFDQFTGAQQ